VPGDGHRRRWGWHQLADGPAQRLVADAPVRHGDLVLDIGAGGGALTNALLAVGARVIAVELHPGRVAALERRFAGQPVKVVRADAADLRLPRAPFHVVANPPFAVTTAIVRRLVSPGSRLVSARLLMPRHAAERWASARHYGAGRWAFVFDIGVGPSVPGHAFRPPAPGAVSVLHIDRHTR
jgi:23S rRNA (adenine-N6)-dimethyltransferase